MYAVVVKLFNAIPFYKDKGEVKFLKIVVASI